MRNSHLKLIRPAGRRVLNLLVFLLAFSPALVFSLPNGGEIVSGSGSINPPKGPNMVIQQNSQQMITNWQGFSIGSKETVTFQQPNAHAVALNRVIGADPSLILGKLSANGQVFLSNPSGVVFGNGAVVDVHGFLATTLNITNENFLKRNYRFDQDPEAALASVVNRGNINAENYVGLLAPMVSNEGAIVVADMGSVALGSGTSATMSFDGDGMINFAIVGTWSGWVRDAEGDWVEDRINNSGLIRANGGQVLLMAKDASEVIRNVVNHTGIIEAQTVEEHDGKIILAGSSSGVINVSGVLNASDVVVTTGDGKAQGRRRSGNIFWNTDYDYAGTGTRDLTLSAHNDIVFNGSMDTSTPKSDDRLNLTLTADSDRNGAGSVVVNEGQHLATHGGDINIIAHDLELDGDLDSGTGDVRFTLSDGGNLILAAGDPNGANVGGDDLGHITAQNLVMSTDGNINVKGITEENTDGIADSVILIAGRDINFEDEESFFPALKLFAITDINVNVNQTTTRGDFIAVADSENNTIGDFNVAPGVIITSARDIDVSGSMIDAESESFNETRNLILNGSLIGDEPKPPDPGDDDPGVPSDESSLDSESLEEGVLNGFILQFFSNALIKC